MKSQRKEILWLQDIQTAIQEIETHPKYAGGETAFEEDKYFRGWCYLQLARISEACVHLADDYRYKEKHPDVLPWRDIRGERMILIHKYWTIDDDVIWDTIAKDLPALNEKIKSWIKEKTLANACGTPTADPEIS